MLCVAYLSYMASDSAACRPAPAPPPLHSPYIHAPTRAHTLAFTPALCHTFLPAEKAAAAAESRVGAARVRAVYDFVYARANVH